MDEVAKLIGGQAIQIIQLNEQLGRVSEQLAKAQHELTQSHAARNDLEAQLSACREELDKKPLVRKGAK